MDNNESQLKFSDVDIYFNYVFDIGCPVNPIDAARRILKTDLGQAFRNYLTDKSEIADRYKPLAEGYKKITDMEAAYKELNAHPSLLTYLKLFRHDPIRFGNAYIQAFKTAFSESTSKEAEEDTESGNGEPLEGFKEWVGQTVTDLLGLLAIHEHVDREIFFSGYLESAPFARVGLQPFGATIVGQSILFDVTLTIHRTGIAILTAYGGFSGYLLLEDILKLERFSALPVQDCEIPTVAIERYGNLSAGYVPGIGSQREYESDEMGYTKFEADEASEYGGIFDAYRYFCIETILAKRHWSLDELHRGLRSNHWHGYPIVFIKTIEPSYPSGTEFKKSHAETLAKLVLGLQSSSSLKPKVVSEVCDEDLSITDDYSLYLTEGSGTVIYYGDHKFGVLPDAIGAEWVRQKFLTTVVIDMILLQRAILFTFNNQLSQATYDVTKLTNLKQEYILALQEFGALGLSHYGSVHDIIKRGHETFRINDLRKLFVTKLEGIESLIQGAEEKHRTSREQLVKILTTLVAVVFSLSAAQSVVNVIKSWPLAMPNYYPPLIGLLYDWILSVFTQHPTTATIVLYFATVAITLLALWYENIKGWRRRRPVIESRNIPKSPELTMSPMSFTIKSHEDDSDSNAEAKPENPDGTRQG